MRRYLLDSGSLGDLIENRGETVARSLWAMASGGVLGICPPLMGEFLGGILGSQTVEPNLKRFHRTARGLKLWPYDRAAAEEYAVIYDHLRRRGRKIQVIDMQLAAVARSVGRSVVVSKDSDLRAVPGIRVEDWSLPEGN